MCVRVIVVTLSVVLSLSTGIFSPINGSCLLFDLIDQFCDFGHTEEKKRQTLLMNGSYATTLNLTAHMSYNSAQVVQF